MLPKVSLLLLSALAAAYPDPLPCSGTCTNTHDPSIALADDGTYFRFSTGGKFAVHNAPSLTGPWKYLGPAIPSGSIINLEGRDDLWAPDVSEVDGTYYLYYSVSSFGSQNSAIGVATSSLLEGPWTDHGSTGVQSASGDDFNAIDGNLCNTGASLLMTFGSFWGDIFQQPMSNPPLKVSGNFSPKNVIFDPTPPQAVEGAFLYHHSSGDFYLFISAGICCGYDANNLPAPGKEYKIKVCRSSSATGPFEDEAGNDCLAGGGTVVLESHSFVYGPGGQGVFDDPKLGPVVYYHYVDTRIGYSDGQKRFGHNQLDFSSGWPVAV